MKKLHGHNRGHSPHSWSHQGARKLQCLLRDPRIRTTFPLRHSCFSSLWKSEVRAICLEREGGPLSSGTQNAQNYCQPCPVLTAPFLGLGRTERVGSRDVISGPARSLEQWSQPQKTGSISRHFLLPFSRSWDLRMIHCNVSLSLCHFIFTSQSSWEKKGTHSPSGIVTKQADASKGR